MDTYKVATVANSESTMHRLSKTPITRDCFSFDDFYSEILDGDLGGFGNDYTATLEDFVQRDLIDCLEHLRQRYNETNDIRYWRALIQLLPESWNQKRTWTANYQTLRAIYFARRYHKLIEWHEFCRMIEGLPYGKELICYQKEINNETIKTSN